MEIILEAYGNVYVLSLRGKLDLASAAGLKARVKSLLDDHKNLIHVCLREVDFINSSGLGAMVSLLKEIRLHRGRLTLSDLAPYVNEIFDITQLSHVFEIFPTVEEAMISYGAIPVA